MGPTPIRGLATTSSRLLLPPSPPPRSLVVRGTTTASPATWHYHGQAQPQPHSSLNHSQPSGGQPPLLIQPSLPSLPASCFCAAATVPSSRHRHHRCHLHQMIATLYIAVRLLPLPFRLRMQPWIASCVLMHMCVSDTVSIARCRHCRISTATIAAASAASMSQYTIVFCRLMCGVCFVRCICCVSVCI